MALSKEQKKSVVQETVKLLEDSKMTVVAKYSGITVKSMQNLRKSALQNNTQIKVIKNRLVIQALQQVKSMQKVDSSILKDQLLYAFNDQDESIAAQILNKFSRTDTNLVFVGAIARDGTLLSSDSVIEIANLPSKDQLKGQLLGLIASPLNGFMNVLNGNLRGFLTVLKAREENIK